MGIALYYAERWSEKMGGAKVYLKREDLLHTGAHKLNNALGQILLAKRMGKTRIVAETGAGQHGVATAACCAKLGMDFSISCPPGYELEKPFVDRVQAMSPKMKFDLTQAVKACLDAEGISIPYPQHQVHMTQAAAE